MFEATLNGLENVVAVVVSDDHETPKCLFIDQGGNLLVASGDYVAPPGWLYTGVTLSLSEKDSEGLVLTPAQAKEKGLIQ